MNLQLILLDAAAGAPEGEQGGLMQMLPFVLIIFVFYFFMIRPQQKRNKEMKKFREELKKGDKVVTTGGIFGKVSSINDAFVKIEIANDVEIKVSKEAVVMDVSDQVAAEKQKK